MRPLLKYVSLALIAALPVIGSVGPATAQVVAPPPLQVEPLPPPPVGRLLSGALATGSGTAPIRLAAGPLCHPPRARAVWVPGAWVFVGGRYVWHRGPLALIGLPGAA